MATKREPQVRCTEMDMPLTVTLRVQGGWWTAICPELMVSGMGDDPHKAMDAVGRSIHSTLTVLLRKGHIAEVSDGGPLATESTETQTRRSLH